MHITLERFIRLVISFISIVRQIIFLIINATSKPISNRVALEPLIY
jgi:hypothetical protein